MSRSVRLCLLGTILSLVTAGCPVTDSSSGPRLGTSSQDSTHPNSGVVGQGTTGGSSSQTGSETTNSDAGDTSDSSGGEQVLGNNFEGTTVRDGLSADYPGCDEPLTAAEWRAEVLRLVNVERAKESLSPLVRSEVLEGMAAKDACELIYYHYFDHVNPTTGSTIETRAEDGSYSYVMIGENLAAGHTDPAKVVTDWMNSPAHRHNIMEPGFTELGVAVRAGGDYQMYWVQEFGRPLSSGPHTD